MIKMWAPWPPAAVDALNEAQAAGESHPYTCRNRGDGRHRQTTDRGVLVATAAGWVCPDCDYTQAWAHPVGPACPDLRPHDTHEWFGTPAAVREVCPGRRHHPRWPTGEVRRRPGRGEGVTGPPCPEHADQDQQTPDGIVPCQAMCFLCGKVTARRDGDGTPWCGGAPPEAGPIGVVRVPDGPATW